MRGGRTFALTRLTTLLAISCAFGAQAQSGKELLIVGDKTINGLDCDDYGTTKIVIDGPITASKKKAQRNSPLIVKCDEIEFRDGGTIRIDNSLLFIARHVSGPINVMSLTGSSGMRGKDAAQLRVAVVKGGAPGRPGRNGRAGSPCVSLKP